MTKAMKSKGPLIAIILAAIIVAVSILAYIRNQSKKPPQAVAIQQDQNSNSSNDKANQPEQTSKSTAVQVQKPESNSNPPLPKQPSLSKSSGNNGPIPSGVNVNFICNGDPNTDCSIILTSTTKQIELGPIKISDNGKGQYFASFYWTSIKGNYKITAQAKNIQGGISSSITQALEVQ